MPITLNCPKCHKPFRVRDESVGGRVRCPTCAAVLQVPGTLAPVSYSGIDAPPHDLDPAELSGNTQRPLADEVAGGNTNTNAVGSFSDMLLGGAGRRTQGGGFELDETALPAPPSIKMRAPVPVAPIPMAPRKPEMAAPPQTFPSLASTAPVPAAGPKPMQAMPSVPTMRPVPLAPPPQDLKPLPLLGDGTASWRKVRSGLRLIRWGLFLWLVPIFAAVAHAAWAVVNLEAATKIGPTILKLDQLVAWQEWVLAYTAIPITLAIMLLFFGRLKCSAAPAETQAGGLMRWAALFTVLAVACAAVGIATFIPGVSEKYKIPSQVGPIALALYLPTAIMADICTLLFIGQIGWPLGRPSLQRSVAGFFAYALFAPVALFIANLFYPMIGPVKEAIVATGNPFVAGEESDLPRRALILGVVGIGMVIMLFLRYAGVAGSARRAIRQHLGE
jgi:predicted Zn finger-like uncharacterized protein